MPTDAPLAALLEALEALNPQHKKGCKCCNACTNAKLAAAVREAMGRELTEDAILNEYDDMYDALVDSLGHNDRHYQALRAVERRVKAELMGGGE